MAQGSDEETKYNDVENIGIEVSKCAQRFIKQAKFDNRLYAN